MSEPAARNNSLVVHLTADELRDIVTDAVTQALRWAPKRDSLLTVEEICEILKVTPDWVYHRAKALPFTRKVGGMLRFSSNGLQRYIEQGKFSVKGC